MADQEKVASETAQPSNLVEVVARIGFDVQGELAIEANGVNATHLIIMLEQMRQVLMMQVHYKRERKVDLVGGLSGLKGGR